MKKILCVSLALVSGVVSYARIVDRAAAEEAARKYLSSEADCVWTGGGDATKAGVPSEPAFYVFQGSGEWVIIAGDDCALPVIAHGPGKFPSVDEMPDNMRFYLDGLGEEILSARAEKLSGDAGTKALWSDVSSYRAVTKAGSGRVGPLTADIKWTQDSPYNNKTPIDGKSRSQTGCLATATAIFMRYHKWPEKGKGTIPAYATSSKKIAVDSINIEGYEYKWDNMWGTVTSSSPDSVKDAVATLMLHIGCMMKMDYTSNSSGATFKNMMTAMVKYMSYKKSCVYLQNTYYSHDEWFALIKREIDNIGPIIYGAISSLAGHAMVCDGYDESTRMISVNWGWGSGGQGWYVLSTMNGIRGGWPHEHQIAAGLAPDYEGESSPYTTIHLINYSNSSAHSSSWGYGLYLHPDCTGIERGDAPFKVRLREVYRESDTGELPVKYKISLYDRDNEVKEEGIGSGTFTIASGKQYASDETDCRITGGCVIGDKIKCTYSTGKDNATGEDIWYTLGIWDGSYFPWTSTPALMEFGAYDLDIINLPSNLKEGRVFYPQVLGGGRRGIKSVVWYYDGEEMDKRYLSVMFVAGRHTIKAKVTYEDGTVKTIMTEFDVVK